MGIVSSKIDFTRGSIIRSLIVFSIPIIMGELLQNLYSSADALVVGNIVGDTALAAVTVSMSIAQMIVSFFTGMSVGSNVVVSRAFGKGNREELQKTIRVAYTFSVCLGVVLSVLGIILTPQFLNLAGARADYYAQALSYLRVYLAGIMFTVIYNIGAGILRAVGDSNTPFYSLFVSCIVNVFLDILLVAVFRMGVLGAALATVASQLLAAVCVYIAINKKQRLQCINFPEMISSGGEIILGVADIGMAAGMQSALVSLSNIFIVRYINIFNTAAVAGIGIGQRLDRFIILPIKSFGITMTTFVGQNIGAENYARIREGMKKCLALAVAVFSVLGTTVFVFTEECVGLFNKNAEVIAVGTAMMHILIPFMIFMVIREILLGLLRGYGKSKAPMLLSLLGMVGFRQLFLYISMRIQVNIYNIYFCYPLAWAATAVLLISYYYIIKNNLPGFDSQDRAG